MGRKNIYDLLEEKAINTSTEYARLNYLLNNCVFDECTRETLYEHIEKVTFYLLPIKGTCVYLRDLLDELGINLDKRNASMDNLFDLIEFIICALDSEYYDWQKERYNAILNNIGIILEKTSHMLIRYKNGRIVVPKDAKVEEAAILAKNESISLELLAYNHRHNTGNVENKAKILNTIAKYYENALKKDKDGIGNDIRFLLNNYNIRHNNRDKGKNTNFIEKMKPEELEKWYDKLYTLFIAFILQIEQKQISSDIEALKKKVKA